MIIMIDCIIISTMFNVPYKWSTGTGKILKIMKRKFLTLTQQQTQPRLRLRGARLRLTHAPTASAGSVLFILYTVVYV